jgi:hypothetical protein
VRKGAKRLCSNETHQRSKSTPRLAARASAL